MIRCGDLNGGNLPGLLIWVTCCWSQRSKYFLSTRFL